MQETKQENYSVCKMKNGGEGGSGGRKAKNETGGRRNGKDNGLRKRTRGGEREGYIKIIEAAEEEDQEKIKALATENNKWR